MSEVLARIDAAFADALKPEHFTDYRHCCECKEHDDTLRARTRDDIRREDLGHMGWDPLTFSSEQGMAYLFPALASLALAPDPKGDRDWYGVQLLWHLSYEGSANRFLAWCSTEQRDAVYRLLRQLASARTSEISNYMVEDLLQAALAAWAMPLRT